MTDREINFTPALARKLEQRYAKAVIAGEEQFTFEGHELLTRYAFYMLELLRSRGMLDDKR